ncbi:MAG TPA: ATP-binding protein [Gemmatimonadaceae bacterium]|nr:ATP-binding protein [Gemmatimonadaceae bacterium]
MALRLSGTAQRRALALVPAFLVLIVGAVAYDRARSLVRDVGEVERSHSVIEQSSDLLTRAVDAETGQRAFLLTGDSVFLDPYIGARADVNRAIDSLRPLLRGDQMQSAQLDSVAENIRLRFNLLESGIVAYDLGDLGTARSSARIMAGKKQMDQLRAHVEALQFRERLLLDQRHAAEERSVRSASLVVAGAAILALLLSGLINLAFSRAIREREAANAQLEEANEDLARQSHQLELQAVEMESQAAELEATAEDLRSTNDELNRATRTAETERDAAQTARRRLERVLENLPDAASVFDQEWRFTYLNPAATRLLASMGVDANVIGRELWEVVPPLKSTRFESNALSAVAKSEVVEFEEYLPSTDLWLENNVVPLKGAVLTFSRDVTRRKRAEEGAKLLNDASRALASTLDYEKTLEAVARLAVGELADWCAVDLVGPDGEIRQVVVSHRDEAKIKWARELSKLYPPDYTSPGGVGDVIRNGKPALYPEITDEMLVSTARDPEHLAITRELQIRSALIVPMIARGRTLGALTLISSELGRRYADADTELAMELATRAAIAIDNAQLYRGALAASEAKSAFLATISHELRTPLNAIIGYASLLEEGIEGELNHAQRGQLGRIRASAGHLLGLIDEVLTFSRVDAGKEVVRREEIELTPLIRDAVAMVTPAAESKRIALRDESTNAHLLSDSGKLRQILINLLSNAIKFSDGGDVVITSRKNGDTVAIAVTDAGIGIAPENLERIFDPFWQVEQRSTRRAGGTGLGLSVSRNLARLLGGDVSVSSSPENGSTFTVTLPITPG